MDKEWTGVVLVARTEDDAVKALRKFPRTLRTAEVILVSDYRRLEGLRMRSAFYTKKVKTHQDFLSAFYITQNNLLFASGGADTEIIWLETE